MTRARQSTPDARAARRRTKLRAALLVILPLLSLLAGAAVAMVRHGAL